MDELHPESLQVCPYDSSHVIRTKRMQMHIYDCRKSHPSTEKESCPFNAAHVIFVAERRWHLATCPDRHQVYGIIAQDLLPKHGCIETPDYKPLMIFEEAWDDGADESLPHMPPPRPQPVAKAAPRKEVSLTEEEVRGLTPRQRQQLYLRKKAEQEAAAKNPRMPPPPNREPLHAQNSGTGQSRSLALFQQKVGREKKAPFDIYKNALKGSQSGDMGIGRGRALAARGKAHQANSPGSLGRGRDQAAHSNSSPSPSAFTPIGHGAGGAAVSAFSPPSSGDASFYSAVSPSGYNPMEEVSSYAEAQQMAVLGRGSVRRAEVQAGLPGLGAGGTPAARGPPAVWQGGAAPVTIGALGQGSATGFASDSMGIPYRGMASQPSAQAPLFSHSTAPGPTSIGPGYTTLPPSGGGAASEPKVPSSDSEDMEHFVDAVGEGYSLTDVGERGPVLSSSSMSLLAAPAIGPWAMEVEKGDCLSESRSVSSRNDSGDIDDSDGGSIEAQIKNLKKLQKKLKQIKELEAKKARGNVLDSHQEEKLEKKVECEREIDRIQKCLQLSRFTNGEIFAYATIYYPPLRITAASNQT